MFKKFSALSAAVAAAMLLAGCQTTPVPVEEPHEIVDVETLDRVHVRDDSALFQEETRGGAAFREAEDSTQVLFNQHHMGEAVVETIPVAAGNSKVVNNDNAKSADKAKAKNKKSLNNPKSRAAYVYARERR